jgi:hypothetical protein
MRWAVLSLATLPSTWVLMVFWNGLGMRLGYWDTFPLGGASVLLTGALASVMSMTVDPVEPVQAPADWASPGRPGDSPDEGDTLGP